MPKLAEISSALGFATPRRFQAEILILLAVCAAGAAWGVFQFSQFDFVRLCRGFDLWFDSDPGRTVANITSRWVMFHERSNLHPLYSLLIAWPFGAVSDIFSIPTSALAAFYVALQGACFCGSAYVAMRTFGIGRFDAILGVVLLNSTAAAIYWIGFTEWTVFGAVSILVSVIWIAAPAAVRNHATGVAQNLISASMVVTNWPIGVAASLASDWPKLRWRQAYEHTRDALALLAALTVVQYVFFRQAGGFLNVWRHVDETQASPGQSIFESASQFFGQTLVAPVPTVFDWASTAPLWGINIISGSQQGVPITPLTIVILALWLTLWGLGVLAAARGGVSRGVMWFVLGVIGFLFALHTFLGFEMFLFSVEFAPLLTFVALWSVRSRYKMVARALCVVLIAASIAHNYPTFRSTVAAHNTIDLSWLQREGHPATAAVAATDCR